MKTKGCWLVMLVMALTLGLTMIGCNNNPTGGEDGTFTLTGIPAEYNGKYAVFTGAENFEDEDNDFMLIGAQSNPTTRSGTAVQIQGGRVSLPMWKMTEGGSERYSGNDTVMATIDIYNNATVNAQTDEPIYTRSFNSITFNNGSAEKTWTDGAEGGLTGEEGEENGGDNTSIAGTYGFSTGNGIMSLVVEDNMTWTMSQGDNPVAKGTYTLSESDVTFTITHMDRGQGWIVYTGPSGQNDPPINISGTISGNDLTLSVNGESMNFVKDDVGGGDDDNGDEDNNGNSAGTFTLTGIPNDYNNKYAIFYVEDPMLLIGAQDVDITNGMSGTAVQISSGSVSLPMWKVTGNGEIISYSGDDTVESGMFMIFNSASVSQESSEPIEQTWFENISFSSGSATKTWNDRNDNIHNNNGGGGNNGITIGNWTYVANDDSANDGMSTITMTQDSNKLTFSGTLNDGYEYAFCNITITPSDTELEKLKTATSISFKVKGDGATYQLQVPTSDITDWSYYLTTFVADTTETLITINISDLTGPGWGQSNETPFDQSKASIIVIQTSSTAVGDDFYLTISDFSLNND